MNMVMNPQVLRNVGNFLISWGTVSYSRRTVLHGLGCLVGWSVGWSVGQLVGRSVGRSGGNLQLIIAKG